MENFNEINEMKDYNIKIVADGEELLEEDMERLYLTFQILEYLLPLSESERKEYVERNFKDPEVRAGFIASITDVIDIMDSAEKLKETHSTFFAGSNLVIRFAKEIVGYLANMTEPLSHANYVDSLNGYQGDEKGAPQIKDLEKYAELKNTDKLNGKQQNIKKYGGKNPAIGKIRRQDRMKETSVCFPLQKDSF